MKELLSKDVSALKMKKNSELAKSTAIVILFIVFVASCGKPNSPSELTIPIGAVDVSGPITPLPDHVSVNPAKVVLGQRLFNDTRLSADGSIACVTCHDLRAAGVDHLPTARGIKGQVVGRNAPTVFNSALNFRQMWDGRAVSLEEQAGMPINNPKEMASSWVHVTAVLKSDPWYSRQFSDIYNAPANAANISDALATFERSLITPNAPFDRFLLGDKSAISSSALEGWRLFRERGCIACHQGINIGGNMFQKFGVMGNFFHDRNKDDKLDQGRYNVTHEERDRHVFKVPSLRNVAKTAPYFHDGSVNNLHEAVLTMGRYQLGQDLSTQEVENIEAFLKSLTGCYQGQCL